MTNLSAFSLTPAAAIRILELGKLEKKEGVMLRITVLGGGCSGFKYQYMLADIINEDDLVFELNGAKVLLDKVSAPFLSDSQLDYVEDLGSAGFEIKNPNATAKCGCGNSFAIM